MIFVKVDPVVMHVFSIPAASWMPVMFTDAAVVVAHVSWIFQVFLSLDGMAVAERKEGGLAILVLLPMPCDLAYVCVIVGWLPLS